MSHVSGFFERVYALVRHIPRGQVASYGQIARLLEHPRGARTVGWALHGLEAGSGVPWQRVVTAKGKVHFDMQRELLTQEGVTWDDHGRVKMKQHRWIGPSPDKVREIVADIRA